MKMQMTPTDRAQMCRWCAPLTFFLLACVNCLGLGFRIPNLDAEAAARGNAWVATADNPAALAYNPAGISQLHGRNLQYGLHVISVNSEFRSPAGEESETDWELQPVPQIYGTYQYGEGPLTFGLGIYAPFGLGLEWPEENPFSTIAHEGRLIYMTAIPAVSYQVHPTLAIGVGPTINYSRVKLRQDIGLVDNDEFNFNGEDFDFGFMAGIRWTPHEKWAFGASYRSATEMDYRGTSEARTISPINGTAETRATVDYPQVIIAGISFRPTPQWNLEVNVDWTDWDTVDTVVFEGTRKLFGQNASLTLNWHSSFLYEFGVTRSFENGYFVSAGYFFSENSTSERHFTPIVPDTDLHVGSIGVGYHGPRWRWAFSAQLIAGPPRTVAGSVSNSLVGESADGEYQWFNQAVNFSIGYHF